MAHEAIYAEDFEQINAICHRLQRESNARAILLIDKNGQPIAEAGETHNIDVVSMASLTASNVAATGAIASLLAEPEFAGQYHEGRGVHVLVALVAQKLILVVLFDPVRATLGLVKLRVRRATEDLSLLFDAILRRGAQVAASPLSDITDDDIDNLFRD